MIFALPYMFSNLLQVLYGSADLFVVGQFGHTFDVSGVSIGSQTMALITNLILGLTTGVTVLLGQYLGSKSYRDLSKNDWWSYCFIFNHCFRFNFCDVVF